MMKNIKKLSVYLAVYVIVFVCIYLNWIGVDFKTFKKKCKLAKKDIAYFYGIEKRLLNDWIACFAPELYKRLKKENRKKLTFSELKILYKTFGNPFTFPTLWRSDLIAILKISYEELRGLINKFYQKDYNGTIKMEKLRKLPPLICKRILMNNEISKSEIENHLERNNKKKYFFFHY